MRRRVLLVFMAIGVGLMFSGCATMDSLNSSLEVLSKHIDKATATLKGENPDAFSKDSDNLEPWKIKKMSETHYVLDPFFAILNVKTREEASVKAEKLISNISNHWNTFGLYQTVQSNGCSLTKTFTKDNGINTVFYYSYKKERCKTETVLSDKLIGTYEYIQLKVLNLRGKWYIVVNHTNAKNLGLFGMLADAFGKASKDITTTRDIVGNVKEVNLPGYVKPIVNYDVSSLIGALGKKIIKINGWSDDFVDVNLDSKDPRAKEYRDWYAKYMKKALK